VVDLMGGDFSVKARALDGDVRFDAGSGSGRKP
jgi:hypothetical protein